MDNKMYTTAVLANLSFFIPILHPLPFFSSIPCCFPFCPLPLLTLQLPLSLIIQHYAKIWTLPFIIISIVATLHWLIGFLTNPQKPCCCLTLLLFLSLPLSLLVINTLVSTPLLLPRHLPSLFHKLALI